MTSSADPERVDQGRRLLLADEVYVDLVETFRVLADATRLRIVHSLLAQELCTCELAAITGTSESVVSQHLRVLRQSRLLTSRRSGRQIFHRLPDTRLRRLLEVSISQLPSANDRYPIMPERRPPADAHAAVS